MNLIFFIPLQLKAIIVSVPYALGTFIIHLFVYIYRNDTHSVDKSDSCLWSLIYTHQAEELYAPFNPTTKTENF